ncbi:MAG: helix-turn-helix transcriptional regulator [Treponema sp.]|jgi:AraC-like DNA-binding protein|nr:helix-turn-helix transcriptional regulator [Treponema sp.]
MDKLVRKQRRAFVSFSSSFLFFVIIPLPVLNIVAWQAIRITEQNERQVCVTRLAEGRDKMDNWIKNTQSIVSLLRADSYLSGLERLGFSIATADYYYIWLALQSIAKLEVAERGLDILIYFPASGLVLSPTFMAGRMEDAYDTFFRFGDYDYEGFLSAFAVTGVRPDFFPAMDYIWEANPRRGLLYGLRLRIIGDTALFFLLREEQALDYFAPVFSSPAALAIYDSRGRLLFSHGGVFPTENLAAGISGESGLLPAGLLGPGITGAYARSASGLLYLSAQGEDTALSRGRALRNLTFALNVAAVFLSLGYALFLAARSSRQLAEAFRLLEEFPNLPYERGGVLSYLNNSVSALVDTNTLLREDAHSRRDLLQAAFLDRLLSGDWESREEAAAAAEQAGIVLEDRRFCLVFLIMSKETSFSETAGASLFAGARQAIRGILEREVPGEALIYSRSPSRMGIFFFLGPERGRGEALRNFTGELFLRRAVPSCAEGGVLLRLVGSGIYDDLLRLREGYNLCREYALVCGDWEKAPIHWIDTLPPPRQRIFVFPLEEEQRLINRLQSADFEGARLSIRSVFAANLREGLLGEKMLAIFYATLQGCFLKSLEGPLSELYRDEVSGLDFRRSPGELEEDFTALARRICASFAAEYSKKNAVIKKEELTAYVEDHFSEERLSLGLAARHFGFSETYFSQMFKEITGENFSTFTEITRLTHAQILLKQYLKVEEVACRCGYKSPNTFRRAYKRYFGINPGRSR